MHGRLPQRQKPHHGDNDDEYASHEAQRPGLGGLHEKEQPPGQKCHGKQVGAQPEAQVQARGYSSGNGRVGRRNDGHEEHDADDD